ncbi:NAD synthetase / Glutamine amidotransferase chain of NAD synthetase [hydrothermal vent metagenome]|uniref:NAD(+) synthase (glutamine-hydrolyzing) n=1 Tax=hydrothermal vent metagenome TaxID=652676 RepID=A0A1W1EJ51_9ZZZZ
MYGFYRIASSVPKVVVANPKANANEIISIINQEYNNQTAIVLFPELSLTGYSVGDLFRNQQLLEAQDKAFLEILASTKYISTIAIIGMVINFRDRLYNCGVVIQNGNILGAIPKSFLPNRDEFYEKRYFNSGIDINSTTIDILGFKVPFGVDLLFARGDLCFGVEVCEDLWAITPPSNQMSINGANIIFNLSASNELVGKARYREELVRTQSARCIGAYIYSSCGVGESSSDTLFGGDSIICEYGSTLARGERFNLQSSTIRADIDIENLKYLRLNQSSFGDAKTTNINIIQLSKMPEIKELNRYIDNQPFVPSNEAFREEVANEITNIQAHGVIKRLTHTHIKKAVIGISGGLDSTLALLSIHKAYQIMDRDTKDILAITMPGFGTTDRTKSNAIKLCEKLGVTLKEIDIKDIVLKEFDAIGHNRDIHNVTYENVQARARTSILMNLANKEGGLVIGTGDLSEIALGWSTYNGDHMSMYSLNSGIPKTLISYLIQSFTKDYSIKDILIDILDTPISPELLPLKDGKSEQNTEDIIGPYILHDFFLYHFIKYGSKPSKILFLASYAFSNYSKDEIKKWLIIFLKRFFTQQFKRNAMPDGVKVGTISLSPRADWRMPSETIVDSWIEELDNIDKKS